VIGLDKPLETARDKEIQVSTTFETTPDQFAALAARPADAQVVMVNLLKFKKQGGRARYLRYGELVAPHLERVGATIRYGGTAPAVIIGDGERPWWDAILIVEYPSPAAFVEMVTTEEYASVHQHRAAALDRGDLIATSIWSLAD
jgi:uncharacterized protein (DUF1330 family)